MSTTHRAPTPPEAAAPFVFHDRYAAQPDDAVAFYATLTPAERILLDRLVEAVARALARPEGAPRCPKQCDVVTQAEPLDTPGRYACWGCGTEFDWPPVLATAG